MIMMQQPETFCFSQVLTGGAMTERRFWATLLAVATLMATLLAVATLYYEINDLQVCEVAVNRIGCGTS